MSAPTFMQAENRTFILLFEGAMKEDPTDLSILCDKMGIVECASWIVRFHKDADAMIEKALSPARLQSAAQQLPLEQSWNCPLIRVGRHCLLAYHEALVTSGIAGKMIRSPPKLIKFIVDWICLLSTPDTSTGSNSLEPSMNSLLTSLLFGISTIIPHGHHTVHKSSAAPTIVALLLSHFNGNKDLPSDRTCIEIFSMLYLTMAEQHRLQKEGTPVPVDSIWSALATWESEVAHAVMWALNSIVGSSAGRYSLRIPSHGNTVFKGISRLVAVRSMRRALLSRGLVPTLCLAARKIVRGELGEQASAKAILLVVFRIIFQMTFRPKQMHQALNAHLVSTILRIPGIGEYVDARTEQPLTADPEDPGDTLGMLCTDFLCRLWTYAAFPSLFASMSNTVRHVDSLIARRVITVRGDHCGSVFIQYAHLQARIDAARRGEIKYAVQCYNTTCSKEQIVGRCSVCKVSGYCSKKCQKAHRETHEKRCRSFPCLALLESIELQPFDIRDMAVVIDISARAIRGAIQDGLDIDAAVKGVYENPTRNVTTIYDSPIIVVDLKTSIPDVKVEICNNLCDRATNVWQLKITMEVVVSMGEEIKESGSPVVAIMFGTWLSLLSNLRALGA